MDYFQTLPPDILRQTALKMKSPDIINLSFDPKFENILNEKFWEEKLKIDKYYKYQFAYIIEEKPYNEYLYKYYRYLQNEIHYNNLNNIKDKLTFYEINTLQELKQIKETLDRSIFMAELAGRIKDRLREVRGPMWPKLYTKENRPTTLKQYEASVGDNILHIKIGNKLFKIELPIDINTKQGANKLKDLFAYFGVKENNPELVNAMLRQIYLLD